MKTITLQTTIQNLLKRHPDVIKVFESKGMYCTTCKGKKHETIQYAATYYGLDPEQFLNEIKEFIQKEEKFKKVK